MTETVRIPVMVPMDDYAELVRRAAQAGFDHIGPWLLSLSGVGHENARIRHSRERREAVLALHARGLTYQEISRTLDETVEYIGIQVRAAGRSANRKPKGTP